MAQICGKDIHLSIFTTLMKSEFDDKLTWPFQGNIKNPATGPDKREGNFHSEITYSTESEDSKIGRKIEDNGGLSEISLIFIHNLNTLRTIVLNFMLVLTNDFTSLAA